jgi:mRNA interferase MazF
LVDKITTVSKGRVGVQIGRLDDEDILRLNHAILVFLVANSPKARLEG